MALPWRAFLAALASAALALAVSAYLGEQVRLVFHFHPAVVAVGAAWLFRRLARGRPSELQSLVFLAILGAQIAGYQVYLAPRGLADPGPLAALIALAGLAAGAWLLLQRRVAGGGVERE